MLKQNAPIPIGTIIVHSIGCGCDEFWQVTQSSNKFIIARKIEDKIINRNIKRQTCDYIPVKNKFMPYTPTHKFTGKRDAKGNGIYKIVDKNLIKLKLTPNAKEKCSLRIGPLKRLIGWNIWQGKPLNQWSS